MLRQEVDELLTSLLVRQGTNAALTEDVGRVPDVHDAIEPRGQVPPSRVVLLDESRELSCNLTHKYYLIGTDYVKLSRQAREAVANLVFHGRTKLGRVVLVGRKAEDSVGDEVGVGTGHPERVADHRVQEFAGTTHERVAVRVFLRTGSLADEQDFGRELTATEDVIDTGLADRAELATFPGFAKVTLRFQVGGPSGVDVFEHVSTTPLRYEFPDTYPTLGLRRLYHRISCEPDFGGFVEAVPRNKKLGGNRIHKNQLQHYAMHVEGIDDLRKFYNR